MLRETFVCGNDTLLQQHARLLCDLDYQHCRKEPIRWQENDHKIIDDVISCMRQRRRTESQSQLQNCTPRAKTNFPPYILHLSLFLMRWDRGFGRNIKLLGPKMFGFNINHYHWNKGRSTTEQNLEGFFDKMEPNTMENTDLLYATPSMNSWADCGIFFLSFGNTVLAKLLHPI